MQYIKQVYIVIDSVRDFRWKYFVSMSYDVPLCFPMNARVAEESILFLCVLSSVIHVVRPRNFSSC